MAQSLPFFTHSICVCVSCCRFPASNFSFSILDFFYVILVQHSIDFFLLFYSFVVWVVLFCVCVCLSFLVCCRHKKSAHCRIAYCFVLICGFCNLSKPIIGRPLRKPHSHTQWNDTDNVCVTISNEICTKFICTGQTPHKWKFIHAFFCPFFLLWTILNGLNYSIHVFEAPKCFTHLKNSVKLFVCFFSMKFRFDFHFCFSMVSIHLHLVQQILSML